MLKEKLEQLRMVFKAIIDKTLYTNYHGIKTNYPNTKNVDIDNLVKLLLLEVKIRINNKGD